MRHLASLLHYFLFGSYCFKYKKIITVTINNKNSASYSWGWQWGFIDGDIHENIRRWRSERGDFFYENGDRGKSLPIVILGMRMRIMPPA